MQHTRDHNNQRVYLDYNATTPVDACVADAMRSYMTQDFGNPSSLHSYGRAAREAVEKSRVKMARALNARESEIFFVSGGTEADNLAIQGVAYQNQHRGRHLITTLVEHPAVLNTCKFLEKQGFEVTYLKVDATGQVSPETVQKAIRKDTILISIIHGNNEVGTLNPIAEIGAIAREAGVYFHSDVVQSFGKVALDMETMPVDLLSISGHKIYGPKGIGALYVRRGINFRGLLFGGSQERGRRAGTENVPAIVGLGIAAELMHNQLTQLAEQVGSLRDYFQQQLTQRFPEVRINGHPHRRLYNTLNVTFPGFDSETLLIHLDMKGIAVSSGSACSSGSIEPSPVLRAMGVPVALAKSSIRFSLGKETTREDIDYVLEALEMILSKRSRK